MQIKLIFTRKVLQPPFERESFGNSEKANWRTQWSRPHVSGYFWKPRFFSIFEKKKIRVQTLADDGNIASLTGHVLYDVWRHRIRKPSFSSVHTISISTLFLKKLHSGNCFQNLKGGKSPFSKIPRYVWMGLVLKLKFGVRGSFKFGCQLVSIAIAKANERSVKGTS